LAETGRGVRLADPGEVRLSRLVRDDEPVRARREQGQGGHHLFV
jgi:hypothetical protein